jgi:hypothetical protein
MENNHKDWGIRPARERCPSKLSAPDWVVSRLFRTFGLAEWARSPFGIAYDLDSRLGATSAAMESFFFSLKMERTGRKVPDAMRPEDAGRHDSSSGCRRASATGGHVKKIDR